MRYTLFHIHFRLQVAIFEIILALTYLITFAVVQVGYIRGPENMGKDNTCLTLFSLYRLYKLRYTLSHTVVLSNTNHLTNMKITVEI